MSSLSAPRALTELRTLKLFAEPPFDAAALTQTYRSHGYHTDTKGFEEGHGIDTIRLEQGTLFVDDLPVLEPSLHHEGIAWHQQVQGHFTSGHLAFAQGGTELHGVIYRGTTPEDAVEHHVLATTIQPVAYKTRITKSRVPAGSTPPASEWTDGLTLAIGYEQGEGDPVPRAVVILDEQDISDQTTWSIDPKTQQTVLVLNLDGDVACTFDPALYLSGQIAFDIMQPTPTFSGTVSATCADPSGTGAYQWTGVAQTGAAAGGQRAALARGPAPITLTHADLLDSGSLSKAELMGIVPDSHVQEEANAMLVENMKWAMAQDSTEKDWLAQYLGENAPPLSAAEQQLVKKSLGWYQGHFAKSYLGWAFANYAGPNAPSVNLGNDQKLKLKYFLQTGLAKDSDFNTQQNGIYLQAFISAKPRLQAYIADGGDKWAQALYDVITSPAQLVLMVNRVYSTGGLKDAMTPANNFATLLSALQQASNGTLAKQYMEKITAAVLANAAHQTTWSDKDDIMQWLPDFLQQFLDQVAISGTVPDEAKLAAAQLQQMLQEMGGKIAAVAEELADFVINANGANILQKTQNAETAFAQKWPRFAKVGQMLFFAGWCMGVMMVVRAFQNWKNLSDEDKAKAILSAVQIGLSALDIVPSFISGVKQMGMDGWKKFTDWRNSSSTGDDMIELDELGSDGDWIPNGASETSPLLDAASGTIKTEGTLWERFFNGASKFVAVIGVAVSAAFAVLSTIDFVNDIRSGKPITQIVFDGIMMVTNIAMTLCLILDLVVASTVFAMAAAVLAVIGVIVALIAMFVIKPENPLDKFMHDTVIPFVEGLGPQTPPPTPGGKQVAVALV